MPSLYHRFFKIWRGRNTKVTGGDGRGQDVTRKDRKGQNFLKIFVDEFWKIEGVSTNTATLLGWKKRGAAARREEDLVKTGRRPSTGSGVCQSRCPFKASFLWSFQSEPPASAAPRAEGALHLRCLSAFRVLPGLQPLAYLGEGIAGDAMASLRGHAFPFPSAHSANRDSEDSRQFFGREKICVRGSRFRCW
jgi:hypothetical protein